MTTRHPTWMPRCFSRNRRQLGSETSIPVRNLLTQAAEHNARLPLVAASILSADFAELGDDATAALEAGADLLHLDVMDGHFVPNLTMGPAVCRSLRRAMPEVCLDVHLMVEQPGRFVQA